MLTNMADTSEINHGVLALVERLVTNYAGQLSALEVIQAVHSVWRTSPAASVADLERQSRQVLDAQVTGFESPAPRGRIED